MPLSFLRFISSLWLRLPRREFVAANFFWQNLGEFSDVSNSATPLQPHLLIFALCSWRVAF